MPGGYWKKQGNIHPLSLKCQFLFMFIESQKKCGKLLKTLRGSSSMYALTNHTNFSQIQTGVTVSLSVMLIRLNYILRYRIGNALTLLRNFIASVIYHPGHIGAIIVSYSYCSKLIDQCYCFCSLLLFCYY